MRDREAVIRTFRDGLRRDLFKQDAYLSAVDRYRVAHPDIPRLKAGIAVATILLELRSLPCDQA